MDLKWNFAGAILIKKAKKRALALRFLKNILGKPPKLLMNAK
jgi:hypothetical protein